MPFFFNATMFFEGRGAGWSESHSLRQDTILPSHDSAAEKLSALAKVRALLLGVQDTLVATRVSLRNVVGDSYLTDENLTAENAGETSSILKNFKVENIGDSAQQDVAMLVKCYAAGFGRFKNFYLRGIPDEVEQRKGRKVVWEQWDRAFAAYKVALTNGIWGWWGKGITSRTGFVKTVTASPEMVQTVELRAPLFVPDEIGKMMTVRFSGINERSPLNGQQVVRVVAADKVETAKPIATAPYRAGGKIRVNINEHITYASITRGNICTREVGAPFFGPRGRAKARPRA